MTLHDTSLLYGHQMQKFDIVCYIPLYEFLVLLSLTLNNLNSLLVTVGV
jgi:hypothetical protein